MAKEAKKSWKRRLLRWGVPLALAWLGLSHFVVRGAFEGWLQERFEGEARVSFALFWPHFAVTAFGVEIEADHHALLASRVHADLSFMALFGGPLVKSVDVSGLVARIEQGERFNLLRSSGSEGDAAGAEADLDPVRLPPIRFSEPSIVVRGGKQEVFGAQALEMKQAGAAVFAIESDPGQLAGIPFEKLTARLMPRGERLIVGGIKLRAFNGVIGGFVDIDTSHAGSVNGELEWHVLELEEIWRTYGLAYAEKRRGDLSGRLVFSSMSFSSVHLKGKGTARLERAEFFSPLSFRVFLVLKVPSAQEAPLNRAEMTFSFENEIAYLEEARAHARDFDLRGRGLLTFDGQVDMEVDHAGTTVAVSGRLEDPTVTVLPLDHITLPFDRLFRERVKSR